MAKNSNNEEMVIAYLERIVDEVRLLRNLMDGKDQDGRSIYVPPELALDAAQRMMEIIEEFGGEPERELRAQARLMAPDVFALFARSALGLDDNGTPANIEYEIRQESQNVLINYGIASADEFRILKLPELLTRIDDFIRAMASTQND